MFGKILLIVIVAFLVTLVVVLIVKSIKKKPTPTPTPVPNPTSPVPVYEHFLHSVETVIRNNLSEEELAIYMNSIATQIQSYWNVPGFRNDFNGLLAKYGIDPINM